MNKSGNLSIREILVVTSAYARLPVRPYRLWGRWGGDARQPDRGTGNRVVHAFGQPAFFLAGNRMTIVACEEDAYLAKQLFASTEVLTWGKTPNIYEWKEKVQKNTGVVEGETFKLRKLPLFSSRWRACPVLKHNLF